METDLFGEICTGKYPKDIKLKGKSRVQLCRYFSAADTFLTCFKNNIKLRQLTMTYKGGMR